MNLGLEGKVSLVVGSSEGLGKACAAQLAAEGSQVVICSRSPEKLERTRKELADKTGAAILAVPTDMTRSADIDNLVDRAVDAFGAIDILITSTGDLPKGQLLDVCDDDWMLGLDMALLSAVRLSRAVLPHMLERGWGRIICLASTSVKQPLGEMAMSSIARMGVLGLTKLISNQFSSCGVCAHTVCPGPFLTEGQRAMISDMAAKSQASFEETEQRWIQDIPMGRHGEPAELANLVCFLASEKAAYMTGNAIQVDGGRVQCYS